MNASALHILPSVQSPEVFFKPSEGELVIIGRSVMLDVDKFYQPILDAFEVFKQDNPEQVRLVLDLEYFSYTSLKKIMHFMYDLKDLKAAGAQVEVVWRRNKGDVDIAEMMEEMSNLLNLSFTSELKENILSA